MNATLSRKRQFKFPFFSKKKKKNSNLKKNPKLKRNANSTITSFPLPIMEVSHLGKQKKRNHHKKNNNNKTHISNRHADPNRKTMPQEIRIHSVAPDSPLSFVSNLTGDPALKEPSFNAPQSFPMLSGGLPSIVSQDDNASSFSMEDLYVSRQLFPSHHSHLDDDGIIIQTQNPFALQLERAKTDKTSFLATSKYFHKLVNWAFDVVDIDQSGHVDKKELYSGLILIHLKLASYLGPAACRPASRKHVYEIFDLIDFNNSGKLNRVEFGTVMLLFLPQIITRVLLHMMMAIIIIPFLSRYIVTSLVHVQVFSTQIFSEVNESKVVKEAIWQHIQYVFEFIVPAGILRFAMKMKIYVQHFLAGEQADTFIFTMIGILLGMILLPWILSQCDELYEYLAHKKRKLHRK
jgi:hypothetical protein